MFNHSSENPEEEISKKFKDLNEHWQPTRPESAESNNVTNDNETPCIIESRKEVTLIWSENPGAFELHLLRRCNNLLFQKERRIVSQSDIAAAVAQDKLDSRLLEKHFHQLVERILHDIGNKTTWGELNKVRERIDFLIETSAGIGGAASEIKDKLQQLRQSLIFTARQGFSKNIEYLHLLNEAEDYHETNITKFSVPFIAQMGRKNSPIPNNELVPSLLIKKPETIRTVMSHLMDTELHDKIRQEALSLLDGAIKEGATFDNVKAILSALGIAEL